MSWGPVYFSLFFAITVIAYNNCGGKFEVAEGVSLASSAQCRAKIMNSAKASAALNDPSICEDAANYRCDIRHFRPEVISGKFENRQCSIIAGMGETCVPVTNYNYNTASQLQQADASAIVEGGAYNRDEATCIHTKITSQNIALIQEEGSSITEALEKSIEQCRRRSRL